MEGMGGTSSVVKEPSLWVLIDSLRNTRGEGWILKALKSSVEYEESIVKRDQAARARDAAVHEKAPPEVRNNTMYPKPEPTRGNVFENNTVSGNRSGAFEVYSIEMDLDVPQLFPLGQETDDQCRRRINLTHDFRSCAAGLINNTIEPNKRQDLIEQLQVLHREALQAIRSEAYRIP